jgi:NitT/TauT family transport system ATP-binding protein
MDLYMPIGELLLAVKSAQMLGLVQTPANDVVLTPVGKTLLKSAAQEQKTLLKTQMLALAVFQHIVKLLKKKKGEAPVNLILEELAMQLPQEQPRQMFTTLLNWGRYAEIFSFSREADLFQLHKPG